MTNKLRCVWLCVCVIVSKLPFKFCGGIMSLLQTPIKIIGFSHLLLLLLLCCIKVYVNILTQPPSKWEKILWTSNTQWQSDKLTWPYKYSNLNVNGILNSNRIQCWFIYKTASFKNAHICVDVCVSVYVETCMNVLNTLQLSVKYMHHQCGCWGYETKGEHTRRHMKVSPCPCMKTLDCFTFKNVLRKVI